MSPAAALFDRVVVDPAGDTRGVVDALDSMGEAGMRSVLMLAAEGSAFDRDAVGTAIEACPAEVVGGLFPGIIADGRRRDRGVVLLGARARWDVRMFPPPTGAECAPADRVDEDDAAGAYLMLVDGLSPHVYHWLIRAYDIAGGERAVVGGGAGSLSLEAGPSLFGDAGLLGGRGQLVGLPEALEVNVRHGWHRMAGPFLVTGATANTIHSLDYRPAFEVYREVIESASEHDFGSEPFFDIAKHFPLGKEQLDTEVLVRDPVRNEDGSLVCVGEVPEFSMVYVLTGDRDSLVHSARRVGRDAGSAVPGDGVALVFDCVSRALFLGDAFQQELDAIAEGLGPGRRLMGALTLGEVASSPMGPLSFHNKTTVLATAGGGEGAA